MIEWLKQQFELWIERREYNRRCISCETLREQLLIANNEKQKLLDTIVELSNPKQSVVQEEKTFEPIKPRVVPWHIRKQMLEKEDRLAANLRKEKSEEIEKANQDLENEVLALEEKVNV